MAGFDDFGNEDLLYKIPKEAPDKFQAKKNERSMPKIAQTKNERMKNMNSNKNLEVTFQNSRVSSTVNTGL
jgi:hypothetical protein